MNMGEPDSSYLGNNCKTGCRAVLKMIMKGLIFSSGPV